MLSTTRESILGNGGRYPRILNLSTIRDEWSASLSGRSTLWERAPDAHLRGGAMGTRVGVDSREERVFAVAQPR